MGPFRLDSDEVARRKAFLEFGEQDVALLTELHEQFAGDAGFFVDAFYAHLLSFEELGGLLRDEATLDRLKRAQTAYFSQLTAGDYGEEYIQNRLHVGAAHERVGLEPKWYIGAYCKYLALMLPRIAQIAKDRNSGRAETVLALLKIVFLDMGIAIDAYINAHQQALQRQSTQISALNQIAVAISSTLGWQELLDRIMRSGIALTGSKAACLAFYDEDRHCFGEWHTQGLSDHFVKNMSFRPRGLASKALASGRHILSNDHPETGHKLSELTRREGVLCFLCLPFVSHTHPLGVLYLYRDDRDTFLPEEIELLATFAHLAAIAAENTRLHTSTVKLAATDALTGLLNRRALDERLKIEQQRTQRYGKAFSLLLLDIDHFKKTNDSHGHVAGDAVLKAFAAILVQQTRDLDSVARYGGEEFVVVLPETAGGGAKVVAERIRKAVSSTPFALPDGHEIDITVSIGIACFPHSAGNIEAMLERADQALYLAKNTGRNRISLYQELLQAELEQDPGRIVQLLNESSENAKAVATAVNMKTIHLRDHADLVERFALRLGKKLKLPAADLHTLGLAAVLHGVGYASIPESVLNQREAFTVDEWKAIQQHPVTGAALLEQVPALRDAAWVVRCHHERHDGGGYPDKLRGEAIPYLARILSVADAYCAMTSDRPQRRAMKPREARAILCANAGSQFDANVVTVFVEMLDEDR